MNLTPRQRIACQHLSALYADHTITDATPKVHVLRLATEAYARDLAAIFATEVRRGVADFIRRFADAVQGVP